MRARNVECNVLHFYRWADVHTQEDAIQEEGHIFLGRGGRKGGGFNIVKRS